MRQVGPDSCKIVPVPPESDGGAVLCGYEVQWRDADTKAEWGTPLNIELSDDSTLPTVELAPLFPGRRFELRLRALNECGAGEFGYVSDPIRTPARAPVPPGTPEAIESALKHVVLKVELDADDGGAPIMGCALQMREAGAGWREIEDAQVDVELTASRPI